MLCGMIGLVLSLLCAWPGRRSRWSIGPGSIASIEHICTAGLLRAGAEHEREVFELTQIVPFDACTVRIRMSRFSGKALLVQRGLQFCAQGVHGAGIRRRRDGRVHSVRDQASSAGRQNSNLAKCRSRPSTTRSIFLGFPQKLPFLLSW